MVNIISEIYVISLEAVRFTATIYVSILSQMEDEAKGSFVIYAYTANQSAKQLSRDKFTSLRTPLAFHETLSNTKSSFTFFIDRVIV